MGKDRRISGHQILGELLKSKVDSELRVVPQMQILRPVLVLQGRATLGLRSHTGQHSRQPNDLGTRPNLPLFVRL